MSKKTFEIAANTNKQVLIQLKDNQKELKRNCEDIVRFTTSEEVFCDTEKNRNRIETRKVSVFYQTKEHIEDSLWGKYIKSVVWIERKTLIFNTKKKQYIPRNETSFYLSNAILTAEQAHKVVRDHWLIENSNHHVRDTSMNEDLSRIRKNPENMARLRSIALNVLRKNNIQNIKGEIYENSLDYNRLYSYKHFI